MGDADGLLLGRDRRRPFTTPTLLLGGDRDALLPARVLTPPASRARSLTVRTVRGGHFVLDENPAAIAAAVLAHLTAPGPARKAMFIAHDRT